MDRLDDMVKFDPYKHKERYLAWKEKNQSAISGISKENSDLILRFLNDMESGINICSTSKKGSRSYIRLNVLKQRLTSLSKAFEIRFNLIKITDISETQLFSFFLDMRNGIIKRNDGKNYTSVKHPVKDFKAFWHWWMKVNKKKGIEIKDITTDLDASENKPEWVYLTEEQVKQISKEAKHEYKVLIWFLFDTGIRAPTELMNVRVCDFFNNFKELNIRQEISKTFGRRIKLMICSDLIKDYIKTKNLGKEDYLFTISPTAMNKYLKRLGKRVLGDEKSPAGTEYSKLTLYDFRHISCCYWLPRYKSESALKYRFGWKESDKIHYYSELLGMSDTINEDDMLVDVSKTEIEQRLTKAEKENLMLREDNLAIKEDNEKMKIQIAKIAEVTNHLYRQMKVNQEFQL